MQAETPAERLRSLLPQVFDPQQREGELFVKLQIVPQVFVSLPLTSIAEVSLVTASEITPIPNMPDPTLGLFNMKGYVFWLIDLAHFLGVSSTLSRIQRYEMIMVHADPQQNNEDPTLKVATSDQFLGLVVQHVQGSFRIPLSDIQSADAAMNNSIASELIPYADSYIWHEQRSLPILSVEKIKNKLVKIGQYN